MHFIQVLSIVLAMFAYYTGIMLIAFAFLLCLKLCWHNRFKPNTSTRRYLLFMFTRTLTILCHRKYSIDYVSIFSFNHLLIHALFSCILLMCCLLHYHRVISFAFAERLSSMITTFIIHNVEKYSQI